MPLYVRDIKLGLDEPEDKLLDRLAARLKAFKQPRVLTRAKPRAD